MSAVYDLTPKMSPFLDVHMVAPLLDFLREVELYDPKEITKEKIKVIIKTNLIDLVEEEYARYPDDVSLQNEFETLKPTLESRRDELFYKIDNESDEVVKVSAFFKDSKLMEELKGTPNMNLDNIATNHGISLQNLEIYYKFGKFKYECGMYNDAEEMLGNFLAIAQPSSNCVLGARWGRLACRILGAKWDLALQDLTAVKEAIEIRNVNPMDQLRQRAWLLHWMLFVHINHRDGVEALAEALSEPYYLQTIENLCPWLLRYYAAFVVLSPTKRSIMLKDVLNEVNNMAYLYSDPMTEFLSCLYNRFDFAEAQLKLKACQELMKNDFFLQIYTEKFMLQARILICEIYCSINTRVDLSLLSQQLHMSSDEAERWMVEMVVKANASSSLLSSVGIQDAKIDSSAKQVIMAPATKTAHLAIVERTKDLTTKSATLANNLINLLNEQAVFIQNK